MPALAPTPRCGSRCRPYRCDPVWLVLAVPDTLAALREKTARLSAPEPISLGTIGFCYCDFHQMSDDEVINLLGRASRPIKRDRAWWMT
jgi:predicted phosphoribosyltransferase